MERKDFLNPKKNPWFEFGKVELFLARRNGQVVGRIAAVNDPRYNEFHKSRSRASSGCSSASTTPAVARGLFDAAAAWVKAQGFPRDAGAGQLLHQLRVRRAGGGLRRAARRDDGLQPALLRRAATRPAASARPRTSGPASCPAPSPPPEKVVRIAEKIPPARGHRRPPGEPGGLRQRGPRIKDIYNAAWEKNWGFVPMTDHEFDHMARR